MLIVGADDDNTVPASLGKAQFKRYESSPAKTDHLEFEGRPHLHMAAADWQEVAAATVASHDQAIWKSRAKRASSTRELMRTFVNTWRR